MSASREALPTGTAGAQAVRALALLPVKALQTERGRRLVAAAGVALALQGMVGVMFANADEPYAGAATYAAAAEPAAARRPAAANATPAQDAAPAKAAPAKQAAADHARPQDAAVEWFARRSGVSASKVSALQQRQVGDNKVKVMVMVDAGKLVDTREVTVTRTRTGWRVR